MPSAVQVKHGSSSGTARETGILGAMPDRPDTSSTTRTMRRSTLALLGFWLAVAALLWAGFKWYEIRQAARFVAYTSSTGELIIPRSRDGHFYVEGEVNHQPVQFLVDTGASSVAVTEQLARAARLPKGQPIVLRTASGTSAGELVRGVPVKVGPLSYNETAVTVGLYAERADVALLGQSFLRHFDVRITAGQMTLRPG